jgi:hypothetical protein
MNIKDLQIPLTIDCIDFRVQSVNKGGYATILAYKDARVDMQRLDEVCGALNWKREHTKDNHNCIVSIYNKDTNQWVSKEDVGTESNTEKDKGLASDSFKRACFNWGIGRELYDYPLIQVKLTDFEFDKATGKPTFNFKLKEWIWSSEFNEFGKLIKLKAVDNNNQIRFNYGVVTEVLLPICSEKLFEKAVERYEGLELDVFDKLIKAYTLTPQQVLEINEITKR